MESTLAQVLSPLRDADGVVDQAVERAAGWLAAAERTLTRREKANRKRISRLLEDPAGVPVTMALTDEVMRIGDSKRAVGTLQAAAQDGNVKALGLRDDLGLKMLGQVAKVLPGPAMSLVHWQVRAAAEGIILPAQQRRLRKHLAKRAAVGARLNINVLGEAVLGEAEANNRLDRVIEMLSRPEVTYVSVKISAIAAQLSAYDHAGSVSRVAERLRRLYRAGQATDPVTFVNLDMEEFRDLALTVDVFKQVLSEPEFAAVNAGIVLQAYLPESHAVFANLLTWATARVAGGGAPIKVRIVKGANLAMEKAEAQLHGWTAAPYPTKADVDASWKRLVDVAMRPENAAALRVGIASHNLFDLAWAVEVAELRGVTGQLDVEMLEGMANAEALAITADLGEVLLYAPVTESDDFASAVAYLVRRLDENTSPENFLRASFTLTVGSPSFAEQERRFRTAVAQRHTLDTASRRHGALPNVGTEPQVTSQFVNQWDGDLTRPAVRTELAAAINRNSNGWGRPIPVVIGGQESSGEGTEDGRNPSADGAVWYSYHVASAADVDTAVEVAAAAVPSWESRGAHGRARILWEAARVMNQARPDTLAVMSLDAGKTMAEGDPEVSEAIDFARYYGRSAMQWLPEEPGGPNQASRPVGVVAVVPPWNFPYAIPAGGVLAALAAGNAVILKPAPEAVATAWVLVQQLWQAGVPRAVLQFVPTRDDEVGRRLVTHPQVNAVILTGSWETARMFCQWRPDIRLMAETSGKNALLISATADIDAAVKDLVQSAFGHAGQKCSAASLAIVEAPIYDNPAFLRQLTDAVTSLITGPAPDPATVVGPVIRPVDGALARALTELEPRESWLVEPKPRDYTGHLWSPGVKIAVSPGSWSHLTEWFGPVLAVMRAPDFATAIAWQNQVAYGLTAGLHALDVRECETWIDAVQAGNAYVNRGTTGAVVNRQPFGGWKRSAVGPTAKAGGENYLPCLRDWSPAVVSGPLTSRDVEAWWGRIGGAVRDLAGLTVERNLVRLRPLPKPVLVRIEGNTSAAELESVRRISARTGTPIVLSTAVSRGADTVVEDTSAALARVANGEVSRVRWISGEEPGDLVDLGLQAGVPIDRRPIAGWAPVEGPRWMHEQSVCITNHRYGNVGAGPHPEVPDLPR
ncbi:MAG: bifunctional proline dehydrogenase/L-glutamate gamma-semialdehyde dehydrogenase [Candidatus Nanopelagicales bacterium]